MLRYRGLERSPSFRLIWETKSGLSHFAHFASPFHFAAAIRRLMGTLCINFCETVWYECGPLKVSFESSSEANTYINVPNLVVYKGQTLFTLKRAENGELGIYFEIYDAEGTHISSVKRNQIYPVAGQKDLYSVDGSADEYILKEKETGHTVCHIRRRPATPIELEVSVLRLSTPDGFLFHATPSSTNLGGNVFIGNVISGCAVGINVQ
jgi:hypothetical protein